MSDTESSLDPTVFVLFGATGDLAQRLVLPSFFRLAQEGLLPGQWRLIGNGRRQKTDDEFRSEVRDAVAEFGPDPDNGPWDEFASRLLFAGDGFSPDDPGELLPDSPAELPPPPVEATPDDPGGDGR